MAPASLPEVLAGGALLFFVPGYAVTKGLFPEWRVRGRQGLRRLVEIVTLSFLLSIVLTVLVGYALLSIAPGGFQATWTDPVLEAALAGVAAVALVVAGARGAFRRTPPASGRRAAEGDEGLDELSRKLEALAREERRLERALAAPARTEEERTGLKDRLKKVRAEADDLGRQRESEYAN